MQSGKSNSWKNARHTGKNRYRCVNHHGALVAAPPQKHSPHHTLTTRDSPARAEIKTTINRWLSCTWAAAASGRGSKEEQWALVLEARGLHTVRALIQVGFAPDRIIIPNPGPLHLDILVYTLPSTPAVPRIYAYFVPQQPPTPVARFSWLVRPIRQTSGALFVFYYGRH